MLQAAQRLSLPTIDPCAESTAPFAPHCALIQTLIQTATTPTRCGQQCRAHPPVTQGPDAHQGPAIKATTPKWTIPRVQPQDRVANVLALSPHVVIVILPLASHFFFWIPSFLFPATCEWCMNVANASQSAKTTPPVGDFPSRHQWVPRLVFISAPGAFEKRPAQGE